jgi:hypothetical protein
MLIMREKYLPIGTVVLLKGGKKRAMITGFCSVAQENQDAITISSDGVVKGKLAELNTYTSTNPAQ